MPTDRLHAMRDVPAVTEAVMAALFDEDLERQRPLHPASQAARGNLIVASGGNPGGPGRRSSGRRNRRASRISGIRRSSSATYLGGTPLADLFAGRIDFTIPNQTRFEHHHIVAGSGHGKTQTLQYLIAEDLTAVARGERSVIVLDSQGDLIRTIAGLKLFAPGEPLHERVVAHRSDRCGISGLAQPVRRRPRPAQAVLAARSRAADQLDPGALRLCPGLAAVGRDDAEAERHLPLCDPADAAHPGCDHPYAPRADGAGQRGEVRPAHRRSSRARRGTSSKRSFRPGSSPRPTDRCCDASGASWRTRPSSGCSRTRARSSTCSPR